MELGIAKMLSKAMGMTFYDGVFGDGERVKERVFVLIQVGN